ncbi:MAG: amidohydrolase family protein, partial [Phycisphaerales bacterium]
TPEMLGEIGLGRSPVGHLREVLALRPMLVAHVNDCGDDDLEVLRQTGTRVVYCPRASSYFGHERPFGPHRYRDMLSAGIPVALGTDSVICLARSDRISVLDEMRVLSRRDGVDPRTLVTMATRNGALALGIDDERVGLRVGDRPLGVIAVEVGTERGWQIDPLVAAMASDAPPEWVVGGAEL